jgi:Dockerin type I domain
VGDACTSRVVGDLDNDGDVDSNDLNILLAARNTPAIGPNDRRDLDHDGRITALDARKLTLLCTRFNCATE